MVQKRYFKELRHHKPLSKDKEEELLERLRRSRDPADRALLVTSNLRFVVSVALHYRGFGVPIEDLINEGNIGLIEAAERFDPNRGIRFITYATWWVRKTILRAVADRSIVRIPPYRQGQIRKARDRRKTASSSLDLVSQTSPEGRGSSPGLTDELSKAVTALDELLRTTPRDVYLNDIFGPDNERSVDDLIPDERVESPEFRLIRDQDEDLIHQASRTLNASEWNVIRCRFGLGGRPSMTLKEIAQEMKISRERVRQIEIHAKEKLRRIILHLRSKPVRRPLIRRRAKSECTHH